ncbi:RicAFT regulatory complex protein RicA family protein [Metabacillus idriensis]|uniref:Master regulator for biofilm formation n=1 Tax=Metabacillus idriensis TaxID=324768 RepID=A0A6I2MD96_9BACI|nr:RicAFT regulatory complex protein RicA family protein [Metabacillus idriensis]MCM3594217.1 RicAFT regulatory complex protein RicA family protein [Metabacillus idriensis]MRX53753.1 hypothetical protein [Metabacillus idriensis]OHR64788.1 hypothetical protein HMPREF3291_13915 [Bacillus sp. HMSC76G11]
MSLYTKEEIVAKARELAQMVADTKEVEFFKKAEEQINENQKIREKVASIKSLQKQAVNFQHYSKQEALKQVEDKIDKIQAELDELPIIQEFKESQVEVNDLLQLIAVTISNHVTDEIIRTTGGDLLSGETGSKLNNSPGSACH